MNEMAEAPDWLDENKVDEILFCQEFLLEHPMVCVRGTFFTIERRITDERELKKLIYEKLKVYVKNGVAKKVDGLLEVLRTEAYRDDFPVQTDRIHLANGTLFLGGRFTREKSFCRNRLPVDYNPNAPRPERWLRFLSELLDAEDIPTLQEFMGYCLIPTTKAQKMLMNRQGRRRKEPRRSRSPRAVGRQRSKRQSEQGRDESLRPRRSGAHAAHGGRRHENGGTAADQLSEIHDYRRAADGFGKEGSTELPGRSPCPFSRLRQWLTQSAV